MVLVIYIYYCYIEDWSTCHLLSKGAQIETGDCLLGFSFCAQDYVGVYIQTVTKGRAYLNVIGSNVMNSSNA